MRRDDEAADRPATDAHRRGHGGLEAAGPQLGDRPVVPAVALGGAELVGDDGPAADAGADREPGDLVAHRVGHADGGDHHHRRRIGRIDQAQADHLVAEQVGGAHGDRVEHLLQRRP